MLVGPMLLCGVRFMHAVNVVLLMNYVAGSSMSRLSVIGAEFVCFVTFKITSIRMLFRNVIVSTALVVCYCSGILLVSSVNNLTRQLTNDFVGVLSTTLVITLVSLFKFLLGVVECSSTVLIIVFSILLMLVSVSVYYV